MKKSLFAATFLLASLGVWACDDDDSSSGSTAIAPQTFDALCESSGGTFANSRCVCAGVTCDSGDLCNADTKACPIHVDPDQFKTACTESGGTPDGSVCTCDGKRCAAWQLCVSNKCPEPAKPAFSQLCSYSGGVMSGSLCRCDGEDCEDGMLCNTQNGKCPNRPVSPGESGCTNDANGVGQLRTCTADGCTTQPCELDDGTKVSCRGNACGTCLNYVSSCENGADGNGIVYMCRDGQKKPLYTCSDGVSCLNIDCADTGCIGVEWCGECHEGDFVCKNGNVPENTKLATYDSIVNVPAGTITGMRSKCVDGKWKQLALDDPENCYYGYLNSRQGTEDFAKYPQITVNGRQIVSVWNYDSSGLVSTQYSLAACAENGVDCGECAYSFSYCSNQKWYTCNNGRVLELACQNTDQHGNAGCATANSCYAYSTESYCKGDSCQNCKAICNW